LKWWRAKYRVTTAARRTMAGMSYLLVAVVAAAGIALLFGGSLRRILETRLRAAWALLVALALQGIIDVIEPLGSRNSDVGFGLLITSYVLLVGFCLANLKLRGMGVVAIGIAMNAAVIVVNRGMPVRLPPDTAVTTTVKHHAERPSDRIDFLGDIIVVGRRTLSFGDLILAVGLVDVLVHCSRAVARGPRPGAAPEHNFAT
jgi:uncharacterized protein DUF5317